MEKWYETRKCWELKLKRPGLVFWLPCHRSFDGGGGGGDGVFGADGGGGGGWW